MMDLNWSWPFLAGRHAFATGGSYTALPQADYRSGWLSVEREAIADGLGHARVDSLSPGDHVLISIQKRLVRAKIKSVFPTRTGRGRVAIRFHDRPGMSVRPRNAIVLVQRPVPHATLVKRYEARKAALLAKQAKEDAS